MGKGVRQRMGLLGIIQYDTRRVSCLGAIAEGIFTCLRPLGRWIKFSGFRLLCIINQTLNARMCGACMPIAYCESIQIPLYSQSQ